MNAADATAAPAPLSRVAVAADGLCRHYGDRVAVEDASLTARPGEVTVLVGGNGAGKSTTLRLLLGLGGRSSAGRVLFGGRSLASHAHPYAVVGAFLGAPGLHPKRRAIDHLRMLAAGTDLPPGRCDEVLQWVGLAAEARRSPRGFSTGQRQRLGVAAAVLHDPPVLVLDEPLNGLDPDGVVMLRHLLRGHAARGGTVLLASHQLDEVERLADMVYVMERGRIVESGAVAALTRGTAEQVMVLSDDDQRLAAVLRERGAEVTQPAPAERPIDPSLHPGLVVRGWTCREVALAARDCGVLLVSLAPLRTTLARRYEARNWTGGNDVTDENGSPDAAGASVSTVAS